MRRERRVGNARVGYGCEGRKVGEGMQGKGSRGESIVG